MANPPPSTSSKSRDSDTPAAKNNMPRVAAHHHLMHVTDNTKLDAHHTFERPV